MLDATTCDNRFGFGRSILDSGQIFRTMSTVEYMNWTHGTYDVHTRKPV